MRACCEGCDRLPPCKEMFVRLQENARGDRAYAIYEKLIEKTNEALSTAKALEGRVKAVHLNDAMAPYQADFWRATTAYVKVCSQLPTSSSVHSTNHQAGLVRTRRRHRPSPKGLRPHLRRNQTH